MNTRKTLHDKTLKLTTLAILTALVIVLQLICTVIKFGPFSITLALTPIIIGAALYGPVTGAFLGFILLMMEYSAIGTTVLCLLKGTAAGFAAGLLFPLLSKKNKTVASIATSAVTPIVNTGLFALGMMTIFYGFLSGNAPAGENPLGMLFLSWIGVNFIVEFVTNIALGTVLTRVVDYFNTKVRKI